MSEMSIFEKCPRCKSMSCETELSTSDRNTKCSTCGYTGSIAKFREHLDGEFIPSDNKQVNMFGKELLSSEDNLRKMQMLKNLDIQS